MAQQIRVDLIDPNPKQPRKKFPDDHIESLAASIRERGLMQPITVRPKGKRYEIVCGECRWRAHRLIEARTIPAEVKVLSDEEVAWQAIVENLQRRDMNPLEEAHAYQSLLDAGHSEERIAKELGLKTTVNIQRRVKLLSLTPEIQHMVATGSLTVAQGHAIALIPQRLQPGMVRDISVGKFKTVEQVRHAAFAICDLLDQKDAFASAPRVSNKDVRAIRSMEDQIAKVKAIVAAGFKDGECIAAKRVDPNRAAKMVEEMRLLRMHLLKMEHALNMASAASHATLFEGTTIQ